MSTAIFYDLENISVFTAPKNYGEFLKSVDEIKKCPLVDEIVAQKAYISLTHSAYIKYKNFLDSTGIEICGVDPKMNANKSNIVDFKMNVDITAYTIAHNIDTVVIATGDGDFGLLCEELKNMGKKVVIASYGITTNKSIVMLCDDWIDFSGKYVLCGIDELCRKRFAFISCNDYRKAVKKLVQMIKDDFLVSRYMRRSGIKADEFISLASLMCTAPELKGTGISEDEFLMMLLDDENVDIVDSRDGKRVVFSDKPKEKSFFDLYEILAGLDSEFSKDRFRIWHEWFSENIEAIPELVYYLRFLVNNSMLEIDGDNASIVPARKCAAKLTENISEKLKALKIEPEKKELDKLKMRFYRNYAVKAPKKEETEEQELDEIFTQAIKTNFGRVVITADSEAVLSVSFTNKFVKYHHNNITSAAVNEIKEYFKGERREFSVPIHLKGTDFQKKVWNELKNIPYGETRTYKEIAEKIGKPKASRAVGMACNKNPIVILVPCHRVVGTNGSLTGYAGGIELKKALLEAESDPENFRRHGRLYSSGRAYTNGEDEEHSTEDSDVIENTESKDIAVENEVSSEATQVLLLKAAQEDKAEVQDNAEPDQGDTKGRKDSEKNTKRKVSTKGSKSKRSYKNRVSKNNVRKRRSRKKPEVENAGERDTSL